MLTHTQTLPKQMRAAQRSGRARAAADGYDALSWLQPSRLAEHGGAPCALAEVVPSPRLKGYRNKCEFTIGKGADGNACVGYQLGKGPLGQTMVGAPTDCNVPPEMLAAVAVIQEWRLRDGQLATFDKWGKSRRLAPDRRAPRVRLDRRRRRRGGRRRRGRRRRHAADVAPRG